MAKIVFRSLVWALCIAVITVTVVWVTAHVLDKPMEIDDWVLSIGLPILFGWPISGYFLVQSERLSIANEQLKTLHAELEVANSALQDKLVKDYLTGVRNRGGFFAAAEQVPPETPCAVIIVDIDHFKTINDTYGHHAGDLALRCTVQCITGTLRSSDVIGRIGGEEFAILLCDADAEIAEFTAEKLRIAIEAMQFQPVSGILHQITVSMGVDAFPMRGADCLDESMQRADKALYEAKNKGRNRVCASVLEARAA